MTITRNLAGTTLAIAPEGRLDTAAAPGWRRNGKRA